MGSYPQKRAGFSLFAWVEVDGTIHGSQSHSSSLAGEQARGKSEGLSCVLTLPCSGGEGGYGEGEVRKYHYKVQVPLPHLVSVIPGGVPGVYPQSLSNALFVNTIKKNTFKK